MTAYADFVQRIYGWREANILVGDTLSRLALRELGDASRWTDLANLNDLREPYIVATLQERVAQPKTLAYGDRIKIPNQRRQTVAVTDLDALYGKDVGLWNRQFRVASGDIQVRSGLDNLAQAIVHRIYTDPGEILRHAWYGCNARQVLGEKLNDVVRLLTQAFIVEALREEPRIASITRAEIQSGPDWIGISVLANPIDGSAPVEANLVLPGA